MVLQVGPTMTKNDKDAFWFTHDSNAHSDVRILELLHRHDWQGYGCFWCLIEILRESPKYRISVELIDALLWQKRIEKKIFDTILEIGLLKNDGKFIFSESLQKRMYQWDSKKKARAEAGKKSGQARRLKKEQNQKVTNEQCSNKTQALFKQTVNKNEHRIEQNRIEQNRIEQINNKKKFEIKPAEPTTKNIAEKYIDSVNGITGRKGNPIKTILPDSWQPNETHFKIAVELGLNLGSCLTDFKDYEAAHRRLMVDWDAAFRMWLRKSKQFNSGNNQQRKKLPQEETQEMLQEWLHEKEQQRIENIASVPFIDIGGFKNE